MTQQTVPHTRTAPQRRPGVRGGSSWHVPVALVVLSFIPVVAGSLRLLEVAAGPQLLSTNPRIDASPAPVVVHVLAAALYAFLGAFQFPARLCRRIRTGTADPAGFWSELVWPSPAPGSG
jgi:hypothetical protein